MSHITNKKEKIFQSHIDDELKRYRSAIIDSKKIFEANLIYGIEHYTENLYKQSYMVKLLIVGTTYSYAKFLSYIDEMLDEWKPVHSTNEMANPVNNWKFEVLKMLKNNISDIEESE